MTQKEHVDEVFYLLKKHDDLNHKAIIRDVLSDIYDQIMSDTPTRELQDFEFHTKEFEVTVLKDTGYSERYYSLLPASIVNLKQPQQGVVSVNLQTGVGFSFWPTTEREVRIYEGLESQLINTAYSYYVKRDRVYYTNFDDEAQAAGVRMALAIQFRDFEPTDEVPLPGGRAYDMKQLAIDYIKQNNILDLQIQK